MILTIKDLKEAEALQTLVFPLFVPSAEEVSTWKESDFAKSPLNACYSKPVMNEKNGDLRSWYEVRITVDGQHDLPPKKEWFYIVTDNGYGFKARFSGTKTKRLSTFEDEEIIGKWLKGRLADWGYVCEFPYIFRDKRKMGVITKEILENYGGDKLILKKTSRKRKDGRGKERDVWFLSFPYKKDL